MGSSKITTKDLSEPVVEALNTIDTVADQVSVVDSNVNSIKSTVEGNSSKLDTIGTNVSDNKTTLAAVNTNCANLNSRITDTRAGYLDYLANSTYGLSAIKTAINTVNTNVSAGSSSLLKLYRTGTATLETLTVDTSAFSSTTSSNSMTVATFIPKTFGMVTISITFKVTSVSQSGYAGNALWIVVGSDGTAYTGTKHSKAGTFTSSFDVYVVAGNPVTITFKGEGATVNGGYTAKGNIVSGKVTGTMS